MPLMKSKMLTNAIRVNSFFGNKGLYFAFAVLVIGCTSIMVLYSPTVHEDLLNIPRKYLKYTRVNIHDELIKYDVCFIKTRKTGSTSLSSILNRFALINNLSLALLKVNKRSGHFDIIPIHEDSPRKLFLPPLGVKPGDWSHYKYNMMTVHVRYNRSAFETFMNPGTKYISILRETCSHFESDFVYYKLPSLVQSVKKHTAINETMKEYMRDPEYYWEKSKKKFGNLTMYFTRNVQTFDLGLDHIYHNNTDVLGKFIKTLEDQIDLMLITEYFDESLLLLKKLLHWDWDDIMYIQRNVRPQNATRATVTSELCTNIKQWNSADDLLYKTFNKTFWRRVAAYGPNWQRDLSELKMRLRNVRSNCSVSTATKSESGRLQIVYKTTNSSSFCDLLTRYNKDILHSIVERQASGYHLLRYKGTNYRICGFEYMASCGFKFSSEGDYGWVLNSHLDILDVTTNSTEGSFLLAKFTKSRKKKQKQNVAKSESKKNPAKPKARAIQAEHISGHVCLNFNFYITTEAFKRNYSLQVCLLRVSKGKRRSCASVWKSSTSSYRPERWNNVSANFTTNHTVQVVFEAISGNLYRGNDTNAFVGLDDVLLQRDQPCLPKHN
ncbi:uncharacterized protein [Ptychodera flava]|uniref:uncharacterized protein n=1 Tax=Ptychodera flava TaxID=63121 RepID=UPI003969ED80